MRLPFSRTVESYFFRRSLVNSLNKNKWFFSEDRIRLICGEYKEWANNYLPVNIIGKTVLDVGAGEGETAWFYLLMGAKRVICVESNRKCFSYLMYNSMFHHEIVPICAKFQLKHLGLYHDLLKMDIEGYEEALLGERLDKPVVCEVHGLPLLERFKQGGYRIKDMSNGGMYFTSFAYWMC